MYVSLPAAIAATLVSNPVTLALDHPPSCTADHAATIARAVRPEYPAIAKLQGLTGTSFIRVDLSDTGAVLGASVAVSSGSSALDQTAIRAVKSMGYAPGTRSCAATPGSYAVEVEFAD